jgi:hypothetical protein
MYRLFIIAVAAVALWVLYIAWMLRLIARVRSDTREIATASRSPDIALHRREYLCDGNRIDAWLNESGQPKRIIGVTQTQFVHPLTGDLSLAMVAFPIDAWNMTDAWARFDGLAAQAQRDFLIERRKCELQMTRGE